MSWTKKSVEEFYVRLVLDTDPTILRNYLGRHQPYYMINKYNLPSCWWQGDWLRGSWRPCSWWRSPALPAASEKLQNYKEQKNINLVRSLVASGGICFELSDCSKMTNISPPSYYYRLSVGCWCQTREVPGDWKQEKEITTERLSPLQTVQHHVQSPDPLQTVRHHVQSPDPLQGRGAGQPQHQQQPGEEGGEPGGQTGGEHHLEHQKVPATSILWILLLATLSCPSPTIQLA